MSFFKKTSNKSNKNSKTESKTAVSSNSGSNKTADSDIEKIDSSKVSSKISKVSGESGTSESSESTPKDTTSSFAPTYSKPKRAFLVFLIITLIGMWSFNGFFGSSNRSFIVNKGGVKVTTNEFYSSYMSAIESNKMKDAPYETKYSIAMQVLNDLINFKVLEKEIEFLKLNISEEDMIAIIRSNKAFYDDSGNFNGSIFTKFLKNQGISEKDFIKKLRTSMLVEQLIAAVSIYSNISPEVFEVFLNGLSQERNCDFIEIDTEKMQIEQISEDEIKFSYAKGGFILPEGRSFKFIKLNRRHPKYNEVLSKIGNDFIDISEIEKISGEKAVLVDFCSKEGKDVYESGEISFIKDMLREFSSANSSSSSGSDNRSSSNDKSKTTSSRANSLKSEFLSSLFTYGVSEIFTFSTENEIYILQIQDMISEREMTYDEAKPKIQKTLQHEKKIKLGMDYANFLIEKGDLGEGSGGSNGDLTGDSGRNLGGLKNSLDKESKRNSEKDAPSNKSDVEVSDNEKANDNTDNNKTNHKIDDKLINIYKGFSKNSKVKSAVKSILVTSPHITYNYKNDLDRRVSNLAFSMNINDMKYFIVGNKIYVIKLNKVSKGEISQDLISKVNRYVQFFLNNSFSIAYIQMLMKKYGVEIYDKDIMNRSVIDSIIRST